MGAHSSKNSITRKESSSASSNMQGDLNSSRTANGNFIVEGKQIKQPVSIRETGISSNEDDFYDGIPRFTGVSSQKSRTRSFRVSARKAGSFGIEKAVNVLDTLGSSVANLNSNGGFGTGPLTKSNELSILSFEVANTIMKGSSLMNSISKTNIALLKQGVFLSDGVQNLVSKDMDEILTIFAADKREELKIFTREVVRFGNRCKDPQWHNLELYFEKQSRGLTRPKQLKEDPQSVMLQLMTLVQQTAELYQELCILDKLEEDHQNLNQGGADSISILKGYQLVSLRQELKSQTKIVKLLKKKSLWSRTMEEVMEKLVDTVIYLNREIQNVFGSAYDNTASSRSPNSKQRLGPAGLALHYANIILQIDSIVARSSSMTSTARGTLYQSLPPHIISSLRSKLVSFRVNKKLSIIEIKAEMEKTLCWLSPVAINTSKAHHGFGWVGEWADSGSEVSVKASETNGIHRIETLHHADKGRTESYIIELLLWLNHLITQHNNNNNKVSENVAEKVKSNIPSTAIDDNQQASHTLTSPTTHVHGGLEPEETHFVKHVDGGRDTANLRVVDFDFGESEKESNGIDCGQIQGLVVR